MFYLNVSHIIQFHQFFFHVYQLAKIYGDRRIIGIHWVKFYLCHAMVFHAIHELPVNLHLAFCMVKSIRWEAKIQQLGFWNIIWNISFHVSFKELSLSGIRGVTFSLYNSKKTLLEYFGWVKLLIFIEITLSNISL